MTPPFRLIIIDDNPDDVAQFRHYLLQSSPRRYRFIEAHSGETGLAACLAPDMRPDCVLLDLHLPDMDGLELLHQLRAHEGVIPFPVLILTGSGSEAGKARAALQAGAQDFIGKSWLTPEGLARAIENAVERFHLGVQLREQKRDAERLKTHFQSLADNSPDCIARFDSAFRHVYINPSIERVTGLPASRFLGRTNWEMGMPEANCRQWDSHLGEAVKRKKLVVYEFEFEGALGRRVYEARLTPEYNSDGELMSILGVSTDITERKQMEHALILADRQKDEFLAMLGHELRNPLAPISNTVAVLALNMKLPADATPLIELLRRQVEHMVRLVDDLLDISRITHGTIELRKSRVHLNEVLQNAVETSRPLIEAYAHELEVKQPSRAVVLDGDVTRLAQVFSNLLNNAAKYTEPGGKIRVAVEPHDGHVLVRVKDNGMGIPTPMLPKVFDIFTQVDRRLERSHGGLGIGLTLVRRLLELHGGSVEARSDGDGCGSEFVVQLPVVSFGETQRNGSGHDGNEKSSSCHRILVVDDNLDAAQTLSMLLSLMGHEVRMVHDGEEAVAMAKEWTPGVILLDIGLPKLNGYEACREIRSLPRGDEPIIIACTGWGQEEDRQRSQAAGFNYHMVKPVSPTVLAELLA